MESMIRSFRESLFTNFYKWLKTNRQVIGDKWYERFVEMAKKAEDDCNSAIKIIATALWLFNMMSNCGVMAGLGPDHISDQTDYERTGLDKKSTRQMLLIVQACLNLQYLPKEVMKQEIPIISGKHFSLKLWIDNR